MEDNQKEKNNIIPLKIVFLGDEAVGKTSIIHRFLSKKFEDVYNITIGALFFTKIIKFKDYSIKYEIWDTAGQERYHSIVPSFYKRAKAAVIVFDLTSKKTFLNVKRW